MMEGLLTVCPSHLQWTTRRWILCPTRSDVLGASGSRYLAVVHFQPEPAAVPETAGV